LINPKPTPKRNRDDSRGKMKWESEFQGRGGVLSNTGGDPKNLRGKKFHRKPGEIVRRETLFATSKMPPSARNTRVVQNGKV